MSNQSYRNKLQELLTLVKKGRIKDSAHGAKIMYCSKPTIKRWIAVLRHQGNEIVYDQQLKRYVFLNHRKE